MKKDKIIWILMIISCILVIVSGVISLSILLKYNKSNAEVYEKETIESQDMIILDIQPKETQAVESYIIEFTTIETTIQEEATVQETTTQEETSSKEDEMNLRILEIDSSLDKMEWFKEYKKIIDKYKEHTDVRIPETIYDVYSEKEIDVMLSCIETEVYTGDFISKCNVASVILNRVYSDKFPNNPIDVITAPNQFAHGRTNITESTRLALEYVYIFGDTTNGCIAFRSGKKPNPWYGLELQFIDDVGHGFYR